MLQLLSFTTQAKRSKVRRANRAQRFKVRSLNYLLLYVPLALLALVWVSRQLRIDMDGLTLEED
jgi:hypothetical protein